MQAPAKKARKEPIPVSSESESESDASSGSEDSSSDDNRTSNAKGKRSAGRPRKDRPIDPKTGKPMSNLMLYKKERDEFEAELKHLRKQIANGAGDDDARDKVVENLRKEIDALQREVASSKEAKRRDKDATKEAMVVLQEQVAMLQDRLRIAEGKALPPHIAKQDDYRRVVSEAIKRCHANITANVEEYRDLGERIGELCGGIVRKCVRAKDLINALEGCVEEDQRLLCELDGLSRIANIAGIQRPPSPQPLPKVLMDDTTKAICAIGGRKPSAQGQ